MTTAPSENTLTSFPQTDPYSGFEEPKPCGLDMNVIIGMAQEISTKMGYDPKEPFRKFLEANGGKLFEESLGFPAKFINARSCILVKDANDFSIHTQELTDSVGRRFDIAHEFGHYILHYLYNGKKSPMFAGRQAPKTETEKQFESEANYFAISFLLNIKEFEEQYEKCNQDALLMSYYFGVSRSTIKAFGKYIKSENTWKN